MKRVTACLLLICLFVGCFAVTGIASASSYDVSDNSGNNFSTSSISLSELFALSGSSAFESACTTYAKTYPYIYFYVRVYSDTVMHYQCVFSDSQLFVSSSSYSSRAFLSVQYPESRRVFIARNLETGVFSDFADSQGFYWYSSASVNGFTYYYTRSANTFFCAYNYMISDSGTSDNFLWYSNCDIWDVDSESYVARANISDSISADANAYKMYHYLSGTNYCITWDTTTVSEYDILRTVIYIDVVFNNVTWSLSFETSMLSGLNESYIDFDHGLITIPLSVIKAALAEQIGTANGTDAPSVDLLTDIVVTSFTVSFLDSTGTEDTLTYTYSLMSLDLTTGALIDSTIFDTTFKDTETAIPSDVAYYNDNYASNIESSSASRLVWSNFSLSYDTFIEMRSLISFDQRTYCYVVYDGYSYFFDSAETIINSVFNFDWGTFSSEFFSALTNELTDASLSSLGLSIPTELFYSYSVIFCFYCDTGDVKMIYTPLYFQQYLVELTRLEDINLNLGSIINEIKYLYEIEQKQYYALYSLYKMEEAELVRQTSYLRSIDSVLSDLNSRYQPFDDSDVITAISSLSFDFDFDTLRTVLTEVLIDVFGENDSGTSIDDLLPDWLVELKNFVLYMLPEEDDGMLTYLIKLFTFYTGDSDFYIDSDADGDIYDEWRSETTWSP